jgi:hypothetical protein
MNCQQVWGPRIHTVLGSISNSMCKSSFIAVELSGIWLELSIAVHLRLTSHTESLDKLDVADVLYIRRESTVNHQ